MSGSPSRWSQRTYRGSIRVRLTVVATLAVVVVLAVASIAVVVSQRRVLTENLDEALVLQADTVSPLLDEGTLPASLPSRGDEDSFVQVLAADGSVVAATESVAGRPALVAVPVQAGSTWRDVDELPVDDARFRVLTRRAPGAEGDAVIVAAAPLDDVDESTRVLSVSLAIIVPLAALALALMVWLLVGRTLRPVEEIRREVVDMGGRDLSRRVPEPDGNDEVARLARTMNAMLARIEHAVDRQRQFLADASHELRSPLTRMRTELEVDLAHPERSDPIATERSVLDETVGMQQLVEDLLHLARSDSDAAWEPDRRVVDLDDLVLGHALRIRAERPIDVRTALVDAVQLRGDERALSRAVGNIADNAARHAASWVSFEVTEAPGTAVIAISDDGPGIPADRHNQVFERFRRLDDARARDAGGSGLGLAIAREVITRHGGTISIDPMFEPGARFVVHLPID